MDGRWETQTKYGHPNEGIRTERAYLHALACLVFSNQRIIGNNNYIR